MNICDPGLDTGERIRRYAPDPALDIPPIEEPRKAMRQYARQLERYIELRERPRPQPPEDWITRHPYLSWALATAALVGSGYWLYRRMR